MDYQEVNFDFNFSDPTLLESEGDFEETKRIMEADLFPDAYWMLESNVMIYSPLGDCSMLVHFMSDGKVVIMEYESSVGNEYFNPDIQAFSVWTQEKGWQLPQPHQDLLRASKKFWKHFWETGLIASDYFDKNYSLQDNFENNENEEE